MTITPIPPEQILFTLAVETAPLTRRQLARATRLSAGTVRRSTEFLVRLGQITEVGKTATRARLYRVTDKGRRMVELLNTTGVR